MCQDGSQLMTGKIIQLINGCFMFEVSGNDGKNKVFKEHLMVHIFSL